MVIRLSIWGYMPGYEKNLAALWYAVTVKVLLRNGMNGLI